MPENHAGRRTGKKPIKQRRRTSVVKSFVQHLGMIADRLNGM
jgi:hypothetical protein